jgi:two-component system LytT family response regulator
VRKIRAVIVEDEPLARNVLRRLVAAEKDVTVVAECGDGPAALKVLRAERPDLVFLDIRLPGMSGLDLLQSLGADAAPAVIFVTASDRHAVRAFSSHAVDYLLKPFSPERFREAVHRARIRLREKFAPRETPLAALARTVKTGRERPAALSLKTGRSFVLVREDEIQAIVADRGASVLHTTLASHRTRQTLTALEKKLPRGKFIQINRSTLVNAAHVGEILRKRHGDGIVRLKSGLEFPLARRWRAHWSHLLPSRNGK